MQKSIAGFLLAALAASNANANYLSIQGTVSTSVYHFNPGGSLGPINDGDTFSAYLAFNTSAPSSPNTVSITDPVYGTTVFSPAGILDDPGLNHVIHQLYTKDYFDSGGLPTGWSFSGFFYDLEITFTERWGGEAPLISDMEYFFRGPDPLTIPGFAPIYTPDPIASEKDVGFQLMPTSIEVVPEPSTLALATFGFVALGAWCWRRRTR